MPVDFSPSPPVSTPPPPHSSFLPSLGVCPSGTLHCINRGFSARRSGYSISTHSLTRRRTERQKQKEGINIKLSGAERRTQKRQDCQFTFYSGSAGIKPGRNKRQEKTIKCTKAIRDSPTPHTRLSRLLSGFLCRFVTFFSRNIGGLGMHLQTFRGDLESRSK